MTIKLRGHHLLCLLGYQGMGYSEAYVENMTRVHEMLRSQPDTLVQLVVGPDDLCAHFPSDKPYHCEDCNVQERDERIAKALGITIDEPLPWREIENRVAARLVPSDIPRFCSTCPWLEHGVCESGVAAVNNGEGLRPLPSPRPSDSKSGR